MSDQAKSWSSLRLQLISLESQTESLLLELVTSSDTLKERAQDLFNKVDLLINMALSLMGKQRSGMIHSLSCLLDPDYGGDTVKQYHVERHIEVLEKHKKEYEKMNKMRNSHYKDTNYLNNTQKHENGLESNESDYFLEESNRIDNSHNMTDQILLQAYSTRDDFYQQKDMLYDMNQKISKASNFLSGVKYFISKISTKRKKNNLILSFVISICIIMIYFMM